MLQDKEIADVRDILTRSDMGKAFPDIVAILVRRSNEGSERSSRDTVEGDVDGVGGT